VTPDETKVVVQFVRQVCPAQRIDDSTHLFWHDILGHLAFDDCRRVIRDMASDSDFISPASISKAVRKIRDERLEGFMYDPAGEDEDSRSYTERLMAQRRAVADGERPADYRAAISPARQSEAVRRLRSLTSGVGRAIPHE
jgi:hypothetical protein